MSLTDRIIMQSQMPHNPALYPYQEDGIRFMKENRYVICADDMGLGKTRQSIETIKGLNLFPCLCIVPASVQWNWYREWERWCPDKEARIVTGKQIQS